MQTWKLKKKVQKKTPKPWGMHVGAILFLLATVGLAVYNFPAIWNHGADFVRSQTGWAPPSLVDEPFRLGLDLQGGTHLIYEADMSQIPEEDRVEALEGVRDVIERRVNAFGVSEPVVQTTTTGGTYRVIIELAGVLDVSEAISLIGETPVLEFKEPGEDLNGEPTEDQLIELDLVNEAERSAADAVLARALAGEPFDDLVSELSLEPGIEETGGVLENISGNSSRSEFFIVINEKGLYPGQVYWNTLETQEGINIFKYLNAGERAQMELSHILICYEGTIGCESGLTELDASIQINEVLELATADNFAEVAKQYSTGPSGPNGGYLSWGDPEQYVTAFGLASAGLEVGEISSVVQTEFGYHIIYKHDEKIEKAYTVQRVLLGLTDIYDIAPELLDPWINTELSGKHLERAGVEFDSNTGSPYVTLTFNAEGGDMFAALTEEHIGEPIAIFLDGDPISTPVVQTAIYGGRAIITGDFTVEESKLLAQRLTAGALPVPVDLLSQQTVGPILGAASLEKSIVAALYGFLLVALYVVAAYRLPGLIAVVALLLFAFMNLAAYRMFGVTITLAGIAGFVLSLGIAVDANVLIIERFKEEYASGRDFLGAVDEAFERAWTAIRDGNITTLIAAGVLYWFSSSFIRGFALTLSIGVILSMFTAILVTRVYLKSILQSKKIRKPSLFGVKR